MQLSKAKKFILNSFWLSFLFHLLLLFLFSFVLISNSPKEKKLQSDYVPAYTASYKLPAVQQALKKVAHQRSHAPKKPTIQKTIKEKPELNNKIPLKKFEPDKEFHRESVLASSLRILQENQFKNMTNVRNEEPIYLIGDKNGIADPLVKLLARALSAHFEYPSAAGEFGIKGRVLVGLVLHPEGYLTDIQVIKSSENNDLDSAALRAVNTAPTVVGADRFIAKPKYFVVGFIFK